MTTFDAVGQIWPISAFRDIPPDLYAVELAQVAALPNSHPLAREP